MPYAPTAAFDAPTAAFDAPGTPVWVSGNTLVSVATVEGHAGRIGGAGTRPVVVDFMKDFEEFVVPCLVNIRLAFPAASLAVHFPRSALSAVWPPSSSTFTKNAGIMSRLLRAMVDAGSRAILSYSFDDEEGFSPSFRAGMGERRTDPASSLSYGSLCEAMVDSFAYACRSVGVPSVPGPDLRIVFKDAVSAEAFQLSFACRRHTTPLAPNTPISVACVEAL